MSPDEEIAIFEPMGRGADPQTLTTVAIATRFPSSCQRSMAGSSSRMSSPVDDGAASGGGCRRPRESDCLHHEAARSRAAATDRRPSVRAMAARYSPEDWASESGSAMAR